MMACMQVVYEAKRGLTAPPDPPPPSLTQMDDELSWQETEQCWLAFNEVGGFSSVQNKYFMQAGSKTVIQIDQYRTIKRAVTLHLFWSAIGFRHQIRRRSGRLRSAQPEILSYCLALKVSKFHSGKHNLYVDSPCVCVCVCVLGK